MNTDTGRKVEKFEDLIAWQKARGLTLKIYQVSRKCDRSSMSLSMSVM